MGGAWEAMGGAWEAMGAMRKVYVVDALNDFSMPRNMMEKGSRLRTIAVD